MVYNTGAEGENRAVGHCAKQAGRSQRLQQRLLCKWIPRKVRD